LYFNFFGRSPIIFDDFTPVFGDNGAKRIAGFFNAHGEGVAICAVGYRHVDALVCGCSDTRLA
jgi:hypothetical protein